MALDAKMHRLYLAAATAAPEPVAIPAPANEKPRAKGRRNYVPGSFVIIVVGE
jgi:hypothetical protein